MKTKIQLPVEVIRDNDAGKVYLIDDNGKWVCDASSKFAQEIADLLNGKKANET